jgi:hypothetical protein
VEDEPAAQAARVDLLQQRAPTSLVEALSVEDDLLTVVWRSLTAGSSMNAFASNGLYSEVATLWP